MSRYLLLVPLLAIAAHADPLKEADKEALLDRLDKLSDAADAKIDARFKVAVTAFREALASDTATMDLYLKCVEKVEYDDNYKKSQDFREWKRKEAENLEKAGLRCALRHQLSWLLLTMEASSSRGKPANILTRMEAEVDSVFADADKLADGGHGQISRSVGDTVFAKAYNLRDLKVDDWPMSPVDLAAVFDRNILPQYRVSSKVPALRAEWQKWIKYEGIAAEKWNNSKDDERDKRVGMKDAMRSSDYDKFVAEKAPEMMWEMEVDAFRSGDQQGAATRMVAHIEKYMSHNKAPNWTKQLRKLIEGKSDGRGSAPVDSAPSPAPAPAPAPAATTTAVTPGDANAPAKP